MKYITKSYADLMHIVDCEVIKHNGMRKKKTLWTDNEVGEKPTLFVANDEEAEAQYVAMKIKEELLDAFTEFGESLIPSDNNVTEYAQNLGILADGIAELAKFSWYEGRSQSDYFEAKRSLYIGWA